MKKLLFAILMFSSFSGFSQEMAEEVIFAHISKNITVSGETIWINLKATQGKEPSASKMAYVEMIDRHQKAVKQIIVPLENGQTEAYLEIPTDLESDHYLLRFYTRISPLIQQTGRGVFNQFITVINQKKPPVLRNTNPVKNKYSFEKPQVNPNLIREHNINISSSSNIDIDRQGESNPFSLSISLVNPFLPEEYKGFIYQEIYHLKEKQTALVPELYGHIIHVKNLSPSPDTEETFFLSAHGKQSVLNTSKPDKNGNLYFEMGPLKNFDFLVAQSINYENQLNFSPQSPFLQMVFKEDFAFPDLLIKEKDKDFLLDLITSAKVSPYFYPIESNDFFPIITGFVADRTYLLDDYTRFDDMETTLREYVPEVLVRKQDKKTVYKVLNSPINALFQENPLILIDGMPVFDTDKLAKFNPSNIQKLEVLTREFFLNKDKFSGVISFSSFENDFGKFELPTNALYFNYWEIQKPKTLKSPHFNTHIGQANYPDFRTSLYWTNNLDQESIRVTSSQITGQFEVILSFLSEDGRIVFYKDLLEVVD